MGCPPSAKPPMAGRAVSTGYPGAVVESVGVGFRNSRCRLGLRGSGARLCRAGAKGAHGDSHSQREGNDRDKHPRSPRHTSSSGFNLPIPCHGPSMPPNDPHNLPTEGLTRLRSAQTIGPVHV